MSNKARLEIAVNRLCHLMSLGSGEGERIALERIIKVYLLSKNTWRLRELHRIEPNIRYVTSNITRDRRDKAEMLAAIDRGETHWKGKPIYGKPSRDPYTLLMSKVDAHMLVEEFLCLVDHGGFDNCPNGFDNDYMKLREYLGL